MDPHEHEIEGVLRRYRPIGPPADLRDRVLRAALPGRPWRTAAGWLAAAAVIGLSIGLHLATERALRETAVAAGWGRVEWTSAAEEAARMLGADGYRYVGFMLRARGRRAEAFPLSIPRADLYGEMR